ncbi:MAM and LDL-receptor class A domain-containing protein 1-like [Physella acuta]|uniref:MAM and LDL-receptor class A domain-containing protein 1-like n=1 Tax=Physella acuta TaxID=109671 RepID=UPI0027DACD02|nr:MAM and LDL-receptor class A domain-containing protein 1-like [Physella acuta]
MDSATSQHILLFSVRQEDSASRSALDSFSSAFPGGSTQELGMSHWIETFAVCLPRSATFPFLCVLSWAPALSFSICLSSLSGDVNLWYCGFNTVEDCGYKRLTGTASFSLEHAGHSSQTGPRFDHSTGIPSGTYISVESSRETAASSTNVLRQAYIESELFEPANAYCVMFWYSMRGVDVVRLDVNIRIGGGTGYPVWTKQGDQKADWLLGQVDLDSEYTANPFKVDFVAYTNAYREYNYYATDHYNYYKTAADIGIDDVYVYNTTCANIPKCPASSVKHTINNVTSCYTFHATPMTWKAAYDFCRREGPNSGLVSIETQQEQDFLVSVITNDPALTAVGQHGFYTSGSDAASEHQFVWTDTGSARGINWAGGWHAGQPNNVGGNQNCLLMEYPSDGYKWGDIECDSTHPFICEVYY